MSHIVTKVRAARLAARSGSATVVVLHQVRGKIEIERPKGSWMINDMTLIRSFYFTIPEFYENQQMILLTFVFYLLPWQSSAFLEEVGLRGYAQEASQRRWGVLIGTLILND